MKGSCLCGAVTYEVTPPVRLFQYCHCSRCRKSSGTAHAANMFVPASQFKSITGEDNITTFKPDGAKYFIHHFCNRCGSKVPKMSEGDRNVLVPAGGLDDDPEIKPLQSIYWGSRAPWYSDVGSLPKHDELPPRK